MSIAYIFILTIIAYTIQSIAGFGSAIFAIPLISLAIDKSLVLPAFYCLSLFQCAIIVSRDKDQIVISEFIAMLIIAALAIPVGIYTGKVADEHSIKIAVGIFIVANSIFGIYRMIGKCEKASKDRATKLPIRYVLPFLSGFLQTIYGIGGPLIALYMESVTIEKKRFRAMLSLYWLCLNPLIVITLLLNGKIQMIHVKYLLLLIPAMLIGVLVGIKIANKISKRSFQLFIHMLLTAIGLSMII